MTSADVLSLPAEIIVCIAHLLPIKDKIQCSLTCRTWRMAFQQSVWHTIHIFRQNTLERFCNCTQYKNLIYTENGKHVRRLILEGLEITLVHLNVFQKYFKKLNYISIKNHQNSKEYLNKEIEWNAWKYLGTLDMEFDKTDGLAAKNKSVFAIKHLPRLKSLKLRKCTKTQQIPFTTKDMDNIHQNLPHLTSLSLDIDLSLIIEEYESIYLKIDPAISMQVFDINTDLLDYKWIGYFVFKYPNLRSWTSCSHKSVGDSEFANGSPSFNHELNHFISRTRQSTPVFTLLENVNVQCVHCSQAQQFTLWKFIRPIDTLLNSIKFHVDRWSSQLESQHEFFEYYVNPFSITLQKTDIVLNIDHDHIPNRLSFSNMINIYHFLTDMSINLEESTLEIDQVLDNCLALKRLKISVLIFSKSFGQPIRPHPHGLRILYIYRSKITTDALGYLSLRCKLLNYMRLDTTEIIGAVSPATGDMRINMTHTCFKALCLYNVVFTTSQCARPNDSRVELVVLSWSKSKNRTKRTKDFSCLDSRANLKAKDLERNWFFLPCAKSKNKPKGGNFVCRLSKRKCDQVSKYFHRFKHTHDFSYMASVSCYSSFIDPSLERFWKANFFRGYVSFECGHVADYVFNNSGVCNEEYWQDLRCNI